ncbi:MAG: fibronectin type III-like domain-contianing protein [Anaerolineaceae bacterium]|nr:fibronectin type III-like domain-contianing protein [Anaerolineaceae bacterium]
MTRPIKELKGFQRVTLKPGETRQVRFTLPAAELSFTGADDRPTLETGRYHFGSVPPARKVFRVNLTSNKLFRLCFVRAAYAGYTKRYN